MQLFTLSYLLGPAWELQLVSNVVKKGLYLIGQRNKEFETNCLCVVILAKKSTIIQNTRVSKTRWVCVDYIVYMFAAVPMQSEN